MSNNNIYPTIKLYPDLKTQYPSPSSPSSATPVQPYTAVNGMEFQDYTGTNRSLGHYTVQPGYNTLPGYAAASTHQYYATPAPTATVYASASPAMEFPFEATNSYNSMPTMNPMATYSAVPPMQSMFTNFNPGVFAYPAPQVDYNGYMMTTQNALPPMQPMPYYPAPQVPGQYVMPGMNYPYQDHNAFAQVPSFAPSAPMETVVHQTITIEQPVQSDATVEQLQKDCDDINSLLLSTQEKSMEIKGKIEKMESKTNRKSSYIFKLSQLQGQYEQAVREAEEFRKGFDAAEEKLVEYKSMFEQ